MSRPLGRRSAVLRCAACTLLVVSAWLTGARSASSTASELVLHYIDIADAEASLAITPGGKTIAFDTAAAGQACDSLIDYYRSVGVRALDYLIVSRYEERTIGCVPALLERFDVSTVLDRGGSRRGAVFKAYRRAVGKHRRRARPGQRLVVERSGRATAASAAEDVVIDVLAVRGRSETGDAEVPGSDESDLGVVVRLSMGSFDAVFGGAIGGRNTPTRRDVEAVSASVAGFVEVYRVHDRGRSQSSSQAWLDATRPLVAILDVDRSGAQRDPAITALRRIRRTVERTYWTQRGRGARPRKKFDSVCGTVLVTATPGATSFDVACGGDTTTHDMHAETPSAPRDLTVAVDGADARLTWRAPLTARVTAPAAVTGYLVEIGTSPGAADVVSTATTATSYTATAPGLGTFYARVRAQNELGTGPPTSDVEFAIVGTLPGVPRDLTVAVEGSQATLDWRAPASTATLGFASAALNYTVEIGRSPGAADVASATTTKTSHTIGGLSTGTYHARVLARNDFGAGAPTTSITFDIVAPDDGPDSPLRMVLFLVEDTVFIFNDGDTAQSLAGWKLVSVVGGESFTFPDGFVLDPGSNVRIIAGGRGLPDPPAILQGWTTRVWDDNGDTARLFDASGNLILEVEGVLFRLPGRR